MIRAMQLAAFISVALLTGCVAKYSVKAGVPTATLVSHVENDSTGTTLRTFWTSTTSDGSCKDSRRLQTTLSAGDSFTSDALAISAGSPFFVSARYGDARFAQNRTCTAMLSFTPPAGRKYQVELQVKDDVRNCSIGLYDTTSGSKERVPFDMPSHACEDTLVRPNGQPAWTDYRIRVQTY